MPAPLNINGWEIVVIAVLFLLLFGPEKLPEIAMQAGRLYRELKEAAEAASNELTRELRRAAEDHEDAAADVREFGESARRILQGRSQSLTDTVKAQLREVDQEIGRIGAGDGPAAPDAGDARPDADHASERAADPAEEVGDA